ncbi:Hypothetical protein D9617_9g024970 [Elsinoe fawcettii]|nr:Hypothetical protein D9617_9g024970 [Elsinoe fawcettii]
MITTALLTLLTTAFAAPTPQEAPAAPSAFYGLAIRSASPIQYSAVNASSLALYLNKPTSTYCPSIEGLPCPTNPATIFVGGTNTLSLKTSVPGGQQVYIASDGRAKFTQAHSANTGVGSTTTGFSVVDGALQFQGNDWIACPEGESYAVYAFQASNQTDPGCLGFRFRVEDAGDAQGAWQYA